MKKEGRWATVAAFIVAIVIFLASVFVCISSDTLEAKESPVNPEEELIDLSEHYMNELRAGNVEAVYENMSGEFQSTYSLEEYTVTIALVFSQTGPYHKTIDVVAQSVAANTAVVITEEYAKYILKSTFVYNDDKEIVGSSHLYSDIIVNEPQSTDKWEETALKVGFDGKLNALLTTPKGEGLAPLVILVHGSGAQEMNEISGASENKPFEDLAHGLADKGIASLRYDKRTYYPGLIGTDVTIQGEVLNDVNSIVKQMSQRNDIDTNRIYVIGHSLGGMLVPVIAAENPEVKGVVSMAGTLRNMEDISYDQSVMIVKQSGLSEAEEELAIAILTQQLEAIKNIQEGDTSTYWNIPAEYWYSLSSLDRINIAKNLEIPMLILQGEDDFQVYADVDYVLWKETLADKDNVTYQLYDGLNHLFMESDSQKDVIDLTVYDAPANVDQRVIDDIANWINSLN